MKWTSHLYLIFTAKPFLLSIISHRCWKNDTEYNRYHEHYFENDCRYKTQREESFLRPEANVFKKYWNKLLFSQNPWLPNASSHNMIWSVHKWYHVYLQRFACIDHVVDMESNHSRCRGTVPLSRWFFLQVERLRGVEKICSDRWTTGFDPRSHRIKNVKWLCLLLPCLAVCYKGIRKGLGSASILCLGWVCMLKSGIVSEWDSDIIHD